MVKIQHTIVTTILKTFGTILDYWFDCKHFTGKDENKKSIFFFLQLFSLMAQLHAINLYPNLYIKIYWYFYLLHQLFFCGYPTSCWSDDNFQLNHLIYLADFKIESFSLPLTITVPVTVQSMWCEDV